MKKVKKKIKVEVEVVKKKKAAKPKKRYLIRELTAFIVAKGPDKVTLAECKKLARQIKPDTTYGDLYHRILVARIKSNLKKSKKKKVTQNENLQSKIRRPTRS
jgi:hypothetical protein